MDQSWDSIGADAPVSVGLTDAQRQRYEAEIGHLARQERLRRTTVLVIACAAIVVISWRVRARHRT